MKASHYHALDLFVWESRMLIMKGHNRDRLRTHQFIYRSQHSSSLANIIMTWPYVWHSFRKYIQSHVDYYVYYSLIKTSFAQKWKTVSGKTMIKYINKKNPFPSRWFGIRLLLEEMRYNHKKSIIWQLGHQPDCNIIIITRSKIALWQLWRGYPKHFRITLWKHTHP